MKDANQPKEQPEKESSFHQEVRDLLKDLTTSLLLWLKPNFKEPVYLIIIKSILKIPVFLLMILISPVALVILAFTFIVLL